MSGQSVWIIGDLLRDELTILFEHKIKTYMFRRFTMNTVVDNSEVRDFLALCFVITREFPKIIMIS